MDIQWNYQEQPEHAQTTVVNKKATMLSMAEIPEAWGHRQH